MSRAWLMLAAGEARQHGGNDGYDDEPSERYHWNSTVPNHTHPARGDCIAIWDKAELLGVSVIAQIVTTDDVAFDHNQCPSCHRASIKRRKVKTPGWRCFNCHLEFDDPEIETLTVRDYQTDHAAAWVDMRGTLGADRLRALCKEPRSQHSIRELDWDLFTTQLGNLGGLGVLGIIERERSVLNGGFKSVLGRARIGQAVFRSVLLGRFGDCCAITGPQPRWTLDAAHLYSYAKEGHHDEYGGLLLRKDVHRLFDLGMLCIDPESMVVDVREDLQGFKDYACLHKQPSAATLPSRTRQWLKIHWSMHRP